MEIYVQDFIQWNGSTIKVNDKQTYKLNGGSTLELVVDAYKLATLAYPKFYKMDVLSKATFVAVSILAQQGNINEQQINATATVVTTLDGSQDVDEKFDESRKELASPALFVYTLPNIMLGEICIKFKFKGEQICTIGYAQAALELLPYVEDLFKHRNITQAIVGYANAYNEDITLNLALISNRPTDTIFNAENYKKILSLS